MGSNNVIINKNELILITGATGFIGSRVVESLINKGFNNLRCFTRITSDVSKLNDLADRYRTDIKIDIVKGDLFSKKDCFNAAKNVSIIYHHALGEGGKSFSNSFRNAVLPTRNLLDASLQNDSFKRFVNISSFAVYSNQNKPERNVLDESCPLDERPDLRGDAYAFGKLHQDKIVCEYGNKYGLPYVILRPGVVYGPGNSKITGRVGIDTFGIFLHLGGSNKIPFVFVDNCAVAIVLSGIISGIEWEVFNIVDDDLPTSKRFLKLYKENVEQFKSLFIPHPISYQLCYLWEKYSVFSSGQLPLAFSRGAWHANWKKTLYSNEKIKKLLGWKQKVPTEEGIMRYCESCRQGGRNA